VLRIRYGVRLGPLTRDILFVYEDGTWLHRKYVGAVERAERTPSIVEAERLARALEATLSEMLAEVERPSSSSGPPRGSG
jgi:hypothetical protein